MEFFTERQDRISFEKSMTAEIERLKERLNTQKQIIDGSIEKERELYAEIKRLRRALDDARVDIELGIPRVAIANIEKALKGGE